MASETLGTLCFDVGGTGLKASVVSTSGEMEAPRVRRPTTYPMSPDKLVEELAILAEPLPQAARISLGFPGVVRNGHIVTAPHFSTPKGPGSAPDPDLLARWSGFDLAGALQRRFDLPARVANDADLQGAAVISGEGLELVVTLGTGFGSGLFWEGSLAPHLELAHHPLADGKTYNEYLGDAARQDVGNKRWRKRVLYAIGVLRVLLNYDRIYVGGGNSRRLVGYVGDDVVIVDNDAGITGGVKLWEVTAQL